MSAPFLSRCLLGAVFTGVGTPHVKALGVLEVWFLYQASRPAVVQLAVPALRTGWSVARDALTAGVFERTITAASVEIAPGPRRVRVLLPTTNGVVALYTPKDRLLDAITDTTDVVPISAAPAAAGGWTR